MDCGLQHFSRLESTCSAGDLGWEDPLEKLPTLVFWPGEFHGPYSPWGSKESDMTEQLSLSLSPVFKVKSIVHKVYC